MSVFRKIEAGANIATIALVGILGWAVFRGSFAGSSVASTPSQPSGPEVGLNLTRSSLKDVDWAANKNTLILGLQTTCHFCTESSPFFQKLQPVASGSTKIIAVLPQTVQESKQYLAKLGVHVDEIRSAPLSTISVNGTPTLLLVDNKGTVRNVWVGRLTDDRQSEVLSAISAKGRGSLN
jgi:hypothetical protein